MWMKGFLFAVLLGIAALFVSNISNASGFWMEIPPECIDEVRLASKLAEIYNSGVPKEVTLKQIDLMEQHPSVSSDVADLARDITEILYTVQPSTNEEYRAIYEGVVSQCERQTQSLQDRKQNVEYHL